jgi:hypothetical protein
MRKKDNLIGIEDLDDGDDDDFDDEPDDEEW